MSLVSSSFLSLLCVIPAMSGPRAYPDQPLPGRGDLKLVTTWRTERHLYTCTLSIVITLDGAG